MWNYRIIKTDSNNYGLFEVIYNDDGEISAHTENAEVLGESAKDLIDTLRLMLGDAEKSYYNILNQNEIKFAPLYEGCDEEESIDFNLDELNQDL